MSKRMDWRALSRRVLAVAKEGGIGDWACYIDAVEGNNHEVEYEDVYRYGAKVSKEIAETLFPNFKDLTYRG